MRSLDFGERLKVGDDLVPIEQLVIDADLVPEVAFRRGNSAEPRTQQQKADEEKSLDGTHVSQNTTFERPDLPWGERLEGLRRALALLPFPAPESGQAYSASYRNESRRLGSRRHTPS